MKKEIVKKVIAKIKKESFNKENVTELFSQLVKVIRRDFEPPESDKMVSKLKEVSSNLFKLKKIDR